MAFLDLEKVQARFRDEGIEPPPSEKTIFNWRRRGEFPDPVKIAGGNYWTDDVIESVIDGLKKKARRVAA